MKMSESQQVSLSSSDLGENFKFCLVVYFILLLFPDCLMYFYVQFEAFVVSNRGEWI